MDLTLIHTGVIKNAHHSFVPDEPHPLLNPIGPLWDQSEVIFTNCFLGCVVSTVSAAHNL